MPINTPVPAAQYVRMSTEHQQYSIENQKAAIQEYAEKHGFTVVQTYTDAGRTGVVLKSRESLRKLLQDVMGGQAPFNAILVYDVSRWGRFQDADEAAHYEFLCKSAGIPVRYCAEQFDNDGSMPNAIMKALKRTMAAEYSRELAVKVYAGQRRLTQLGIQSVRNCRIWLTSNGDLYGWPSQARAEDWRTQGHKDRSHDPCSRTEKRD